MRPSEILTAFRDLLLKTNRALPKRSQLHSNNRAKYTSQSAKLPPASGRSRLPVPFLYLVEYRC